MEQIPLRKNVAAIILSPQGRVLMGKRRKFRERPWQFPQGGLKAGETPREGLWRELEEEVGPRENLKLVSECPQWLDYLWPESERRGKKHLGQTQKYFLLTVSEEFLPLENEEFQEFCWVHPTEALGLVADFKREVYFQALKHFKLVEA